MLRRSMDTETMGYAYVYPREKGAREEYMVALTAENLANLIGGKGGRRDSGSKPGGSRRILCKRRTGGCHGRVPDAGDGIKRWKERVKDMGWILGFAAIAAVLVSGTAGLACIAVCRVGSFRLD